MATLLLTTFSSTIFSLISARWLVPEMAKNGVCSSFVYWSLIWACFVSNSWRRVKMAAHGFQRI
jgi:hypothetical protein